MTATRRARVAGQLSGVDALLVTSLANVRWLTGLAASRAALLLGNAGTVLCTDGRYAEQARQVAPGVDLVVGRGDGWLAERVTPGMRLGVEDDVVTWRRAERLRELLPGVDLVAAGGLVEAQRVRKDPEELQLLASACRITASALTDVFDGLRPGLTEREVAARVETSLRDRGADDRAFETIVASGPNGSRPHHHAGDRRLEQGELVTIDAGALVEGYHADMTRTVALGRPRQQLAHAYETVRVAQAAGVAAVAAGVTAGAVDDAARAVLEDAGFADAIRHATGHGVGLEIHEPPLLHTGEAATLPDGAVVTVEPGVYLAGVGGIRIEDTVSVTATGCDVLTAATTDLLIL